MVKTSKKMKLTLLHPNLLPAVLLALWDSRLHGEPAWNRDEIAVDLHTIQDAVVQGITYPQIMELGDEFDGMRGSKC